MRIRSVLKHSTMAVLEGALVASLVVGLMAGTALAGKGGGGGKPSGGGSSNMSVRLVTDNDGNGLANWGDQVTFNNTTSNAYPVASVTCSQGGSVVYGAS